MSGQQRQARPCDLWTILAVIDHADGGRTLTMRNRNGVTKTENYPAGHLFYVAECPNCGTRIRDGRCPQCGYTVGQETP